MITVYALLCPLTHRLRYVAATKYCPRQRWSSFTTPKAMRRPGKLGDWLRELNSHGLRPWLVVLERTNDLRAKDRWVELLDQPDNELLNGAQGLNGMLGRRHDGSLIEQTDCMTQS